MRQLTMWDWAVKQWAIYGTSASTFSTEAVESDGTRPMDCNVEGACEKPAANAAAHVIAMKQAAAVDGRYTSNKLTSCALTSQKQQREHSKLKAFAHKRHT